MASATAKPFAVHVIVRGLIVAVILLLSFVVESAVTGALATDPSAAALVGFIGFFSVLFLIGAWLSWRENKWGFLLTALVGIVFILLFGSYLPILLMNPAVYGTFVRFVTGFFLIFLVTVFALLAFKNAGPALREKPYLRTVNSTGGLFTILIVGLIIGALMVGFSSGLYIEHIVSKGLAPPGAVSMVRGAVNNASGGDTFSPSLKTVTNGTTVIWWNADLSSHTVTSEDAGPGGSPLFNSGEIEAGTFWSHAFPSPGTFRYFCTPHPYMHGTINVTA